MFAGLGPHGVLSPSRYLLEGQSSRAPASRRVLECISGNFLTQVVEEPMKGGSVLDLVSTNKKELVGGNLGCHNHMLVQI